MGIDVSFPSERDKLLSDLAEHRAATADERLQAVFDLARLCEDILAASPARERQLELLQEIEEAEHRRWRELARRA
ncbi:MAG: hypothetical protein HY721_15665 [Planctomycetes bacterium]|nr:hypothetical protein [Planctomycetota bacterium]